ncbi:MAG: 50S ribosomal protein L20 [Deltaproteobacteria bacterium]|nr:50S ribosomal protein L20 [Deltaproteobacteria bacterium]
MRIKRGFKARRRRNRLFRHASGFYSGRGRQFAQAQEAVRHGWAYAYRHRREKKRNLRRLFIVRIGAAVRPHGMSYSRLIHALKLKNVQLDRKILADLAVRDPGGFKAVVDSVR